MTFVQSKGTSTDDTAATTIALTLNSSVSVGDTIILNATHGGQADDFSSVTDNLGNTYTRAGSHIADTVHDQAASTYVAKVTTGGTPTITVTFVGALSYRGIMAHVESGINTTTPVNQATGQFQSSPGTATDGVTSGAATTTADGCRIIGFSWNTGDINNRTQGTNFTDRLTVGTGSTVAGDSEDRTQTTQGSIAATFTQGANDSALTFMVALTPAGGGTNNTQNPTGFSIGVSLGTAVPVSVLMPTGFSIATTLGTPTVVIPGSTTVNPTGMAVTMTLGTFDVQNDVTILPGGGAIQFSLGTVSTSATTGAVVSPTGFSIGTALGTPTTPFSSNILPSGFAITSTLGTATPVITSTTQTVQPTGFLISVSQGSQLITGVNVTSAGEGAPVVRRRAFM